MKRPIIYAAIYYILGLLAGHYLNEKSGIVLSFILVLISEAVFMKFNKLKIFFIFTIISVIGFCFVTYDKKPISLNCESFCENETEVHIEGIVKSIYVSENGYTIIELNANKIYDDKIMDESSMNISVVYDKITDITHGMKIKVYGVLEKGENSNFSGMFSESNYMYYEGIEYKVYADTLEIISYDVIKDFNYYLVVFREIINSKIDNMLPIREGGILKAMITGEKNYIDDYYTDIFEKAGISHILAVSGLHMSVVSGFIYFIFYKIMKLRKRTASIITIPFIILFTVFCGCTPSVVRACIMTIIILFGNVIREESDLLNSVGIAALIILLVSPKSLYSIGFQLSFLAITGVGAGIELSNKFDNINKIVKSVLFVSMGAYIMTVPLCIYYFYGVSVVGIILNIVIIPIAGFIVILGMIAVALSFINISVGIFFSGAVFVLINFTEKLAAITEKSNYMYIKIGSIDIISVLLFYIAITISYMFIKTKYFKYIAVIFSILFCISINMDYILKKNTVTFIDVGEGDAAVYNTYDGFTAVIDGGGHFMDFGSNTAVNNVIPYLEYKGIKNVDILFISNTLEKNCKGEIELIENFDVSAVVMSDYNFAKTGLYTRLIESINERNIPLYKMSSSDIININENINFEILYPITESHIYDGNEIHGSIVIKLNDRNNSILFTGNINEQDENIILSNNNIKADIIKIQNNGNDNSFTENFVKNIDVEYAISSSKEDISNKIKNILDKYAIKYYNTSVNKDITINLHKDYYKIIPAIETE